MVLPVSVFTKICSCAAGQKMPAQRLCDLWRGLACFSALRTLWQGGAARLLRGRAPWSKPKRLRRGRCCCRCCCCKTVVAKQLLLVLLHKNSLHARAASSFLHSIPHRGFPRGRNRSTRCGALLAQATPATAAPPSTGNHRSAARAMSSGRRAFAHTLCQGKTSHELFSLACDRLRARTADGKTAAEPAAALCHATTPCRRSRWARAVFAVPCKNGLLHSRACLCNWPWGQVSNTCGTWALLSPRGTQMFVGFTKTL